MNRPLAAALICLAFCASAQADPAKKAAADTTEAPLATVNGVAVPHLEARIMTADRIAAGAANTPALQIAVRNHLIQQELLSQQARKAGISANPNLAARIRMVTRELTAEAYAQDYVAKHPATDEEIANAYTTMKGRAGTREYHVRHIVVDSEDAAKSIVARLKGGAKFADVAAESKDPAVRAKGGDQGWLNRANMPSQLGDVVAGLDKGQFTAAPIKDTSGSWHLIQVEDVRPFTMPPLDDKMRQQLRVILARQAIDAHVAELAKSAKIE